MILSLRSLSRLELLLIWIKIGSYESMILTSKED